MGIFWYIGSNKNTAKGHLLLILWLHLRWMKVAECEFRGRAGLEVHRKFCKGTCGCQCSQARLEIKLSSLLPSGTQLTAAGVLALQTGSDSWKILRRHLVGLLRCNMVLFPFLCKHARQEFAIVTTKLSTFTFTLERNCSC